MTIHPGRWGAATAASPPKQIQIPRTGDTPLRFTGIPLATATSEKPGKQGAERDPSRQWYEITIYQTQGGGIVAEASYRTLFANERDYHWAAICATPAEAVEWLQQLDV